jgi:HK97 family phage major capsid protein
MLDAVDRAALAEARNSLQRGLSALDIVSPPSRVGLSTKETRDYSLGKVLRALVLGDRTDLAGEKYFGEAGLEWEAHQTIAKRLDRAEFGGGWLIPAEVLERALSTVPGSKGGYLIGTQTASVIDYLRMRSVAFRLGAQSLSGLTSSVPIPRQTGKATATWQGVEGTSVTATDQTLGELSLAPKTVIALTDCSEQLLKQTGAAAEAFIARDLGGSIAEALDGATINGTGGAQPLGIKNTTGITTGQDSGTATLAKLLAFPAVAGAANAIGASPGWIANTAGAVALAGRQNFSGSSLPLWTGSPTEGTLTGYPAISSEQVASANLIFGSWDSILIGDWGVLELQASRGGTRFNVGQVGIRAFWMVDVLLRYPQAFVVSTNLS